MTETAGTAEGTEETPAAKPTGHACRQRDGRAAGLALVVVTVFTSVQAIEEAGCAAQEGDRRDKKKVLKYGRFGLHTSRMNRVFADPTDARLLSLLLARYPCVRSSSTKGAPLRLAEL